MSKTVARFSLIFARKVHFSEKSSIRENFCQETGRSLSLLKITMPRGVLGMGGALASAKFVHGVHAHASGNYACIYMSDKNAFICH